MKCPLCGYMMDAFDKDCPRCHGKGLAPAPQTPDAPPQSQSQSTPLPSVAVPISSSTEAATGVNAFDSHLIAFTASAVVFCLGYLAPWVSVSFFGFSAGSGGPMGLEFFVFIMAIAAAGICVYERTHQQEPLYPQVRASLSAACFIFAAGELLYFAFMSHIVQIGFGLPLMLVSAGSMIYFSFLQLPQRSRSSLAPAAGVALLCVLAWAGYKGYQVRKSTDFSNIFSAAPGTNPFLNPNRAADSLPQARTDVVVQLNSTTPTASLQPTSQFGQSLSPDAGKTFLICNVTITFKGTAGSLNVDDNDFRMSASNKQIYQSKTMMFQDFQNFKGINATLLPDGTATGDVLFEVDTGAQPDKVEFVASLF